MKKLFSLALLLLASIVTRAQSAASQAPGQVTPGPGNDAGLLYASSFGQWSVPQGNTGQFSWSSPTFCTVPADGIPLSPVFAVATPVLIKDQVPANTETVAPSAVNVGGSSCSITVSPSHKHNTFTLQSGTAGLQEAINYAHGLPYVIILTSDWTRLGGTTGMIAAANGNANVSIIDERNSCFVAYSWSGSAYAEDANFCSGGSSSFMVYVNDILVSSAVTQIFVNGSPI